MGFKGININNIYNNCSIGSGLVNPNLFSPTVQQLLAAIQPHLFNHPQHDQTPAISPNLPQQQSSQQHTTHSRRHSSQSPPIAKQARVQTPKQSPLRNSCTSNTNYTSHHKYEKGGTSQHTISTSDRTTNQQHSPANYSAQHLSNGHVSSGPSTPHGHHSHLRETTSSSSSGGASTNSNSNVNNASHHHHRDREQSPSAIAINSISRYKFNNRLFLTSKRTINNSINARLLYFFFFFFFFLSLSSD